MTTELATLTGSEKQIAWATEIRAAMLAKCESAVQHANAKSADATSDSRRARWANDAADFQMIDDLLRGVSDAHIWIECRDSHPGVVLHHGLGVQPMNVRNAARLLREQFASMAGV